MTEKKHSQIIIVGGGFAGLNTALGLKKAAMDICLIDKTNHHLFQPLLYQIAVAALSPGDIAVPLRAIFKRQKNVRVLLGEVLSVDPEKKEIHLSSGQSLPFDFLVLAPGARHFYFNHPQWEKEAPGLKTLEDGLLIREKILYAFERAETLFGEEKQKSYLTFAVVGGGPTGVEMAAAIAEIAQKTMLEDFRNIDPSHSRIFLIEGGDRLLPTFPPSLSEKAKGRLEKMGVEVLLNSMVSEVEENRLKAGDQWFETHNIIWAAGNRASPLLSSLKAPLDSMGRVKVKKDLSVPGHPQIFVLGDGACMVDPKTSESLPGIAPVAIQQGKYLAKILSSSTSPEGRPPFVYKDRGIMATIGRSDAVAVLYGLKLSGFLAWLAWCFIHILFLIDFRSKILVMMEWCWYYVSYRGSVRLITDRVEKEKRKEKGSAQVDGLENPGKTESQKDQ